MRTVDEIKAGILGVLEKLGDGKWEPAVRIREAYTADGLIKAMLPFMKYLVDTQAVSGKMLAESFPQEKLMQYNIFVHDSSTELAEFFAQGTVKQHDIPKASAETPPVRLEKGVGLFFGDAKGILSGSETVGRFFEKSEGRLHGSRGYFYGESTGVVFDGGRAVAFDKASLTAQRDAQISLGGEARGQAFNNSSMLLKQRASGEAYGNSYVFAAGKAYCNLHDHAYGEFNGQSVFRAAGSSLVEAFDEARGSFWEKSSGNLYDKAHGCIHGSKDPEKGTVIRMSPQTKLAPISDEMEIKFLLTGKMENEQSNKLKR